MKDIWVISDTHFGHENIIKYCDRPFESVYHMNQALLTNWNSVVKPQDHVWHLGDVYFPGGFKEQEPSAWEFMKLLNGKKRLVLGNHDNAKNQLLQHFFEKIVLWRDWKDLGLLLTHVPVHPDHIIHGKEGKPRINVHGHIHNRKSPEGPYRNVSVEWTEYSPIHIEELK